jgi:D-alanyl-D-alanine carboxypeptidase
MQEGFMKKLGVIGSGVVSACLIALMAIAPAALQSAAARTHVHAHTRKPANKPVKLMLHAASATAPGKDAALVEDGATGRVLYARNADDIRYPASLTKMMTLYLLFDALEKGQMTMDSPLTASTHASLQSPTKLYLQPGQSIPVELAIKAITVLSANDVAVTIAENLGGTESNFAEMMTKKAHALGMTNTNFHNASGLPDKQQLTTARDMATLGRHLAYDFPQYFHYFSTPSFFFNNRVYKSHDNLLGKFQGTDGIKTGFTGMSGFNLVTSVVRDNKHVVGVVMGGISAASRDQDMERMLGVAFDVAEKNPTLLADANVPWEGGKGPAQAPFKTHFEDSNILVAALEGNLPAKDVAPVLTASAEPAIAAPVQVASATVSDARPPLVVPVPAQGSTFGEDVRAPKAEKSPERPARLVLASVVPSNLIPDRIPLPAFKARFLKHAPAPTPKPTARGTAIAAAAALRDEAGQDNTSPAGHTSLVLAAARNSTFSAGKRWAVQIGAFVNESVAEASLAAYVKKGAGLVARAQKFVIPVSSADGHRVYRARFGLFAENQAKDICRRMTERGETCFAAPAVE